jgi:tRNA-splicing ligase RtcB
VTDRTLAPVHAWLVAPLAQDVSLAIDRLRRAPDVQHVAVMPDVHLAADVCIGVVVATTGVIYPQAVGGDIGCGMLAVATDATASALGSPDRAGRVLAGLGRAVPARRRNRRDAEALPGELSTTPLREARLEALRQADARLEFATLGSGNHFIELQADKHDRLWLMIHSGSRGLGPAIRDHYQRQGQTVGGGLWALDATSDAGADYLADAAWARAFAEASRRAMAERVETVLRDVLGAELCWDTAIATDHNHVGRERHGERELWVHRKGAMQARAGQPGVLPGSMGTASYHVEGRGHALALCSSAHGAGRILSRTSARRDVTARELRRQMAGVWFDYRLAERLRDEAPRAYKDVGAVARAGRDLVKVTRVLRPRLNYKGV